MQAARHAMSLVERSATELVFLCDEAECGRRLMIDARDARLVVIDPGDRTALHDGGTGGITLLVTAEPGVTTTRSWSSDEN